MAVYFLNLKTFGRSGGSSAVSAAAYRAGERIRDERTGRVYDHTDRQDILHKEILVPSQLADSDMSWAKDRSQLWNAAESAESRKDARVAREYLVALPVELDAAQRLNLVRSFSQELTDRYQFALDLSVHEPRRFPGSDPRNFHAHLLATTREATSDGLAAKTTLELNDAKRRDMGLEPVIHELLHVRGRWAQVTNEALREANIDARVDHRSLAAQGIDREPYPYIPRAAYEMERHGYRSHLAERLRADYEARVAARAGRTISLGLGAEREPERASGRESGDERGRTGEAESMRGLGPARDLESEQATVRHGPPQQQPQTPRQNDVQYQNLDEIRRRARENWLKVRQELAESAAKPERARIDERSRDDDRSRNDDLSR